MPEWEREMLAKADAHDEKVAAEEAATEETAAPEERRSRPLLRQ